MSLGALSKGIADMNLKAGMVIRHHSGRVYSVLHVANTHGNDPQRFPVTIVYRGANGHVWSRPASAFEPASIKPEDAPPTSAFQQKQP